MNQQSRTMTVKQIQSFLAMAVMVAPFIWVGQIQAKSKPKAEIAQASPFYKNQTILCPVALPFETEGKTVTCCVLTLARSGFLPGWRTWVWRRDCSAPFKSVCFAIGLT